MKLLKWAAVLGVIGAAASCTGPFDSPPPPAATPIINNITPASDGGTSVLLAVCGVGLLVVVVVAVVAIMGWWNERNRRMQTEDAFMAVTGQPVNRSSLIAYRYATALPVGQSGQQVSNEAAALEPRRTH